MSQAVLQTNVERVFGRPEAASEPIRELTVARPQLKVVAVAEAARPRSPELSASLTRSMGTLAAERAALLRRIAYLRKSKQLFEVWHALHRPLAISMTVVVVLHAGMALHLGYAFGAR